MFFVIKAICLTFQGPIQAVEATTKRVHASFQLVCVLLSPLVQWIQSHGVDLTALYDIDVIDNAEKKAAVQNIFGNWSYFAGNTSPRPSKPHVCGLEHVNKNDGANNKDGKFADVI